MSGSTRSPSGAPAWPANSTLAIGRPLARLFFEPQKTMVISSARRKRSKRLVYENALAHELRKAGLAAEQQRGITVIYDGIAVGQYFVDLLVEQASLSS